MRVRREVQIADIDPGDRVILPKVEDLNGKCFTVEFVTYDLSHAWPRVNLWLRNGPHRHTIAVHYSDPAVIFRRQY